MRDDKSRRPAKWASDARQRASAWLAIGELGQRLGREETQAGEQTAHACGVARALICFHSLMLRDFVALISPCGSLAESGDVRESYADKRTVPMCMALSP
jgi:hypothetical protein